jgi:adenylyltransferase/sulfurtransferase
VVSIIASLQTAEVLKHLTHNQAALRQGLLYVDVWSNQFRSVAFPAPKPDCPCCGQRRFASLTPRADALTVSFCGRRTIQVRPASSLTVSLEAVGQRLARIGRVTVQPYALRFEGDGLEVTLFPDGRALIHGVEDETVARSAYARYIGM